MQHTSATNLKNHLGQYLETAIKETVIVEKSGRPISVLMSYEEFQRLSELEDQLWAMRALKAEKDGYLGVEESVELLRKLEKRISNDHKKTGHF
ncbi:MAG: type II toxin-antitoxin system Phd/YefM family antitoxin [Gammaproteobacteria bacterium]